MKLDELFAIRRAYQLKGVNRDAKVRILDVPGNNEGVGILRSESSSEHSWSATLLCDFFLDHFDIPVDRLKVMQLIMVHDLVEIHTGDVNITDHEGRQGKEAQEKKAAVLLKKELGLTYGQKYYSLFLEYEAGETLEAQFAKVCDKFDSLLHELDFKDRWKGWSRAQLCQYKEKYFAMFPNILKLFYEICDYVEKERYFE